MKEKLRPLHTPSPVAVRTDDRGQPVTVDPESGTGSDRTRASPCTDRGIRSPRANLQHLEVVQIREVWRIDDEWWREPVSRLYYEVVLENGKRIVLYRDLAEGGWYRQRG